MDEYRWKRDKLQVESQLADLDSHKIIQTLLCECNLKHHETGTLQRVQLSVPKLRVDLDWWTMPHR